MDTDILFAQVYKTDTGDAASMRTGIVRAVDPIRGLIDVDVAGELLRDIPYAAGLAPVVDGTVWLIEQGSWFAAISAAASSGQYGGVDEVLVGGEPPTAVAVDLWMDTNEAGEGDGWAALDARYLKRDGDTSDGPLLVDMDPVDDMQVVPRRYAVAKSGDQMTGTLESALPGSGGNGAAPNVRVVRDVAPGIVFDRRGASLADFHKWKVYLSGTGSTSGPDDTALTFAAVTDDEVTNIKAVRIFRDGRMLIGADPTAPLEVATKRYSDSSAGTTGVVTPSAGYVDHGGYGLQVVRTGRVGVINGQFRPTSAWTSDGYSRQIGTVPAGFRPAQPRTAPAVFVVGSPMTSGYACVVVLNPDGQLRIVLASGIAVTVSAANYFSISLPYQVD